MPYSNDMLRLRAGAVFFVALSLIMWFIMAVGWMYYRNLQTVVFVVLAITYFLGGTIALIQKNRKAMFPVFIANSLALILLLTFFLLSLYGYFTDPCYIEPGSCDDQLTDSPAFLKALGFWTVFLSSITFMSWRLQKDQASSSRPPSASPGDE